MNWMRLEHVLEFKYFRCVLDEPGTNDPECRRKVVNRRKVEGTIMSLVNASGLQVECARLLSETLFMPVLMYSNETMIQKESRSRISAVQKYDGY